MSIPSRMNRLLESAFGVRVARRRTLGSEPEIQQRQAPFSAHGEERLLLDFLAQLPNIDHSYADVGAGDGMYMSNTACLALDNWRGACFELNRNQAAIMATAYRQLDRIFVCQAWITPKNIVPFLGAYALPPQFGVLSLDIDSYDYYVLDAILRAFHPTLVICEINEKFPPPLRFAVHCGEGIPYGCKHFYGASIAMMASLAAQHGYKLLRLEYNNLFLVAGEQWEGAGIGVQDAYDQGYRLRPDRQQLFPWNANMEALLTLPREQALQFIQARYADQSGDYELDWDDTLAGYPPASSEVVRCMEA